MSPQSIVLSEHYDRFVEEQVSAGRFQDAGEVFRAGLKLLEVIRILHDSMDFESQLDLTD